MPRILPPRIGRCHSETLVHVENQKQALRGGADHRSWPVHLRMNNRCIAGRCARSDNRSEQLPDSSGECHRQRTPECHPGAGTQDVRAACFCTDRAQKSEKSQDAADTMGTRALADDTTTINRGMAAPAENVTADVSAACTGRAVVMSEIPSSSRACAVKASFAISCWATCRASA